MRFKKIGAALLACAMCFGVFSTTAFRSVYKELHADHETGLLTTKQAEYQAPGKCEIFSLFCCPGFPKGHPLAHDFACKV